MSSSSSSPASDAVEQVEATATTTTIAAAAATTPTTSTSSLSSSSSLTINGFTNKRKELQQDQSFGDNNKKCKSEEDHNKIKEKVVATSAATGQENLITEEMSLGHRAITVFADWVAEEATIASNFNFSSSPARIIASTKLLFSLDLHLYPNSELVLQGDDRSAPMLWAHDNDGNDEKDDEWFVYCSYIQKKLDKITVPHENLLRSCVVVSGLCVFPNYVDNPEFPRLRLVEDNVNQTSILKFDMQFSGIARITGTLNHYKGSLTSLKEMVASPETVETYFSDIFHDLSSDVVTASPLRGAIATIESILVHKRIVQPLLSLRQMEIEPDPKYFDDQVGHILFSLAAALPFHEGLLHAMSEIMEMISTLSNMILAKEALQTVDVVYQETTQIQFKLENGSSGQLNDGTPAWTLQNSSFATMPLAWIPSLQFTLARVPIANQLYRGYRIGLYTVFGRRVPVIELKYPGCFEIEVTFLVDFRTMEDSPEDTVDSIYNFLDFENHNNSQVGEEIKVNLQQIKLDSQWIQPHLFLSGKDVDLESGDSD